MLGLRPMYWATGDPEDGWTIYFYFRGFPADQEFPDFSISQNNLISGNGKPEVTLVEHIA
jgi:hypothetical protein